MKKSTILGWIKSTCSSIGWKLFIWGLGISEEKYWDEIYEQEKRKRMFIGYGLRRVGNSTRIVDHMIQNFFKKGSCAAYDHHPTREATRLVFNTAFKRLQSEHNIQSENIKIDKHHFVLTNLKHELHNN